MSIPNDPATSWLPQFVAMAKDVIVAVAALVASYVGILGLRTWRRQLHGTAEYEAARNILREVNALHYAIGGLRSRVILAHEFPDGEALQRPGASREELGRSMRSAYEGRWRRVQESASKLQAAFDEGELFWGDVLPEHARKARALVRDLHYGLTEHLEYTTDADLRSRTDPATVAHARSIAVDASEGDLFGGEIDQVVEGIRKFCQLHMRR